MSTDKEPVFVILGKEEPDLEKMQSKIMDMLENGRSINDIAVSLKLDPQAIQGYADTFNRQKWQNMSLNEMRKEYVNKLNEMIALGQLQYMADPQPPHAFATSSLMKTSQEILRDIEASDNLDGIRDRIQDEVIQGAMEQLVISITKEIGQTRKILVESLPIEKRAEAVRLVDDIARALAIHTKTVYEDAIKQLYRVFDENTSKQKNSKKTPSTALTMLVPNVDPR